VTTDWAATPKASRGGSKAYPSPWKWRAATPKWVAAQPATIFSLFFNFFL